MKVDVTFVNFPASESIRALVASRIESRISKFSDRFISARAVFSVDRYQHHVRLLVSGTEAKATVSANSTDIGHAIDQALDKLGAALRKVSAKRKTKRSEASWLSSVDQPPVLHRIRGRGLSAENAFDRFESEFVRDFESEFEKAG